MQCLPRNIVKSQEAGVAHYLNLPSFTVHLNPVKDVGCNAPAPLLFS